jgi:hypothetical protein
MRDEEASTSLFGMQSARSPRRRDRPGRLDKKPFLDEGCPNRTAKGPRGDGLSRREMMYAEAPTSFAAASSTCRGRASTRFAGGLQGHPAASEKAENLIVNTHATFPGARRLSRRSTSTT